MSINGYEQEDWILTQWGLWDRDGGRHPACKTNWSLMGGAAQAVAYRMTDEEALVVNAALAKLQPSNRQALKRHYSWWDCDVDEGSLRAALADFAHYYSGKPAAIQEPAANDPEPPRVRVFAWDSLIEKRRKEARCWRALAKRRAQDRPKLRLREG